jgi:hypothetical protein
MASEASKQMKNISPGSSDNRPKHKKLIQMLSFRVVPAYYKEIEKVADNQKTTVSKLIRNYIKEGMKRDGELTDSEEKEFGLK